MVFGLEILREQKKRKKLKNKMEIPSINNSMKGIGSEFRNSIPSLKVGLGEKPSEKRNPFNKKDEDILDKLRNWGLIACIVLVVFYAIYRLFFG